MRSPILAVLLLALTLPACTSTGAAVATEPQRGPVEITLDSKAKPKVTVTLGDSTYKIHLKEINDSRCPNNAKCVWAGELAAVLKVDRDWAGYKESKSFTLGETTTPSIKIIGASFELVSISETSVTIRVAAE